VALYSEPTFQRCVKEEASGSNEDITNEGDQEDCIMTMLQTVSYAFASKVHEQKVRERVDYFCGVGSDNIVLRKRQ
jgi:hypothetical protein